MLPKLRMKCDGMSASKAFRCSSESFNFTSITLADSKSFSLGTDERRLLWPKRVKDSVRRCRFMSSSEDALVGSSSESAVLEDSFVVNHEMES